MPSIDSQAWALLNYAITLSDANALTIRALGERVDYSVDVLENALGLCREFIPQRGLGYDLPTSATPAEQRQWHGIEHALGVALRNAESRAYRARARSGSRR